MNVLVTGASGFIGSRVLPLLAERGHVVTAVASARERMAHGLDVMWVIHDLRDPELADALPAQIDAVVHLAQANTPTQRANLIAVNVGSTEALLRYALRADAASFVLASSGSVYGGSTRPLRETDPRRPSEAYAHSKVAAEDLVEGYGDALATCALRIFAPYGPGQQGRLVADLVGRVATGRAVTLRGGGHPHLNPIYVDDVAEVIVEALAAPKPRVVNVAGAEVLSIREMASVIGRVVGREPHFEDVPGDAPLDLVADTTLLRRHFRLPQPQTPFERGIAEIAAAGSRSAGG